jgi:hypothetical protein
MATDPEIIKKLSEDLDNLNDIIDDISKNIVNNMNKSLAVTSEEAKNLANEFEKGNDITKNLEASLKRAQRENRKLGLDQNTLSAQLLEAQENLNKEYNETNKKKVQSLRNALQDNRYQQQLNESVIEYLRKLDQINETERKNTEEKRKQNSLGKGLLDGLEKNLGVTKDQIKQMFTLAGMAKMVADGLFRANNNSVWISKNIGYSAAGAYSLTARMQLLSLTTNETAVSLKSLQEAMVQLAAATGGVADDSRDTLETQIMLTRQLGLTGEEAAGIYKFGVLTAKSSSQVNKEMISAFANTRNMVRGSANFKETMAAAAKVSGQLAANFRNNPGAITAAIVQMQALGTTLEQTKKQGESLLDFESSLESELKAELLTGKQLNLERARAAALAGDQVTLAEELRKNAGSLEDFQKMNVLAQKSLAEAMGMTTDELANQLSKQKIAQEQGKTLAQVSAEELEKAEKRKTIQDKFNNMMEKLQDIVGSIGTLFSPLIEGITWLADHSLVVYGILGLWLLRSKGLADNFKGIVGSVKNIGTGIGNKILGKGAGGGVEAAATTTATSGGTSGFTNAIQQINPTKLLAGAAALTIAAGAMFILGKAMQEFKGIGLETYLGAGAALVGLSLALAGLSLLGPGIVVGAGALLIGASAILVLGKALQEVGKALPMLTEGIATIFPMLISLAQAIMPLLLLGPALLGIAGGLAAMGISGILALPSIIALTALGAVAPALTSLGIGGGGTEEGIQGTASTESNAAMVAAINEVRDAVNKLYSKEGIVSIDGKKIGTLLTQGSYKTA